MYNSRIKSNKENIENLKETLENVSMKSVESIPLQGSNSVNHTAERNANDSLLKLEERISKLE